MAASGSAAGRRVALVAAACVVLLALSAVQGQPGNAQFVRCTNCYKDCIPGCIAKCEQYCSFRGIRTNTVECRKCQSKINACAALLCYLGKCVSPIGCPFPPSDMCRDCDISCEAGCARDEVVKPECKSQCQEGTSGLCAACTGRAIDKCSAACYNRDCVVERLCPSRLGTPQACGECNSLCDARCIADEVGKEECKFECDKEKGSPFCLRCIDPEVHTCTDACYARDCVDKHVCPPPEGTQSRLCRECASSCQEASCADQDFVSRSTSLCHFPCLLNPLDPGCVLCKKMACTTTCYSRDCVGKHGCLG